MKDRVLCICFASVGELRLGAILDQWGDSRRQALETALQVYVTLDVDAGVVQNWAEIKAARQRIGRPIASEDCWIAASALRHGIPLLTHNASDYANIAGLTVISHQS